MESQSVAETIAQGCKIRPALKPFLKTFEPLLAQRRATAEKLAPLLAAAGKNITGKASHTPLLQENLPAGLAPFMQQAASDLLPLLQEQQVVTPHFHKLEKLFLQPENEKDQEGLLEAMLAESPDALLSMAEKYDLAPELLEFASEFIIGAVLRGLAANLDNADFPDWRKGICPVCGFPPVLAWLAKKPLTEKNEFLSDGGGKKHLHCGICGSDWYFLRGVCPECGTQGQDAMQILGEEDRRHERIDWCKKCRAYLPLIDLRELADTPDMDAMALCLMHLDLVASGNNLAPIKPSFWNTF